MPIFAFTVGSLGNIVSLLQIANKVIQALCNSKGSSAEYFDLILELDSMVRTVESMRHELSIEGPNRLPMSAENGLQYAIRRCLDLLQQMESKISDWRGGFSSGWTFGKDAWLRLGWCLFTREELIGLRRRLSGQIENMNILLILAHGERLEQFGRKQDEHTLEIRRKQDEIASEIRRGNIDRGNPDWFPAEQVHELMCSYISSQPVPAWESWASAAPLSSPKFLRQTPRTSHNWDRSPDGIAKFILRGGGDNLGLPPSQSQSIPGEKSRELELFAPMPRAGSWHTWKPNPDISYTPMQLPASCELALPPLPFRLDQDHQ